MELYNPVVGRWRACSNATSNIEVKPSSFGESAEIRVYNENKSPMSNISNNLYSLSHVIIPITF